MLLTYNQIAEYERQIAAADLDHEYKAVINGLEKRVKECERTNERIYKSHRSALEDRSKFETEIRLAEALLETAKTSAVKESEAYKSKIADLETTIARLTTGSAIKPPENPAIDVQLKETQDKIQVLEKRLANARQEADYARTMYQEASGAASSVGSENIALKERNVDLEKKASENLVRIHQINAENSAKYSMRQMAELKTRVREKDTELDRIRDELRQLRSGRRETRQVSVPRSPRMGMMSPRTARTYAGSASRGTSPAPDAAAAVAAAIPGMQFLAQTRWPHIQE